MSQISDACGGGDAGRPLVAGSLRGYRTWRLRGRRSPAGPGELLPLTSVTRRDVVWTRRLAARCAREGDDPAPGGDHAAPESGCTCGIYGWYSPTDSAIVHARVFGCIEATGRVVMGEQGFRAERATITAVVTRNRRLAEACERAGVAVYRRRRDLLRDHPPEDVSSLLGPPEPAPAGESRSPGPALGAVDGLMVLAVWGRAAVIAAALALLPAAAAVATAVVAQFAIMGVVAAHLRRRAPVTPG